MPRLTLLWISADRIARADFDGELLRFGSQPRPPAEDLATLGDAALRLLPESAGRVWVLTTEVWSQVVELGAAASTGLSGEALHKALAFETEPLAGIAAYEAAIGLRELAGSGGRRRFQVAVAYLHEREQLAAQLEGRGATLLGILHPAALPARLSPGEEDGAERLELWPGVSVGLRLGANPELYLLPSDARQGIPESLTPWSEAGEVAEVLAADDGLVAASAELARTSARTPVLGLAGEEALQSFLAGWAQELARSKVRAPLIVPPRRPLGGRVQALLGAVFVLLVCVGCAFHYLSARGRMEEVQTRIDLNREVVTRINALRARERELDVQRGKLDKSLAALESDLAQLETAHALHKSRHAGLLDALAAHVDPAALSCTELVSAGTSFRVRGICLAPTDAHRLATTLEAPLAALGWRVQPPTTEAHQGGTYRFELRLEADEGDR